jgi:general secretion pathway protein A
MYKHFFGLRENPFNFNPDPHYLFLTSQTQEALDELTYGVQTRKGLILLTGEVGTGKTTLINRLLDWLRQQKSPTAFIFNSHLEISDLFDFMLADFGAQFDSRSKDNARMRLYQWLFERYRAGDTPVLIVDEAQGLPNSVLEEIRMLLNLETSSEKLLQIVLVGQPELDERLNQLELRQIKQRIALRCKTAALTLEEAHDYIQARLHIAGANGRPVFASQAMDAVHFYSRGIPRIMNLLCEHALINAYVEQVQPVPAHIVAEVAREFQFDDIKRVAPCMDSVDALGPNSIPAKSRFLNALASLSATTGPLWKEHSDPSTTSVSGPFAVADSVLSPMKEPDPLISACEKTSDVKGDAEASKPPGDQRRMPTVLGLRQAEARLLAECTAFLSDVGTSLASELEVTPAPLAQPPRLHLVEAKGGLGLSPASSRSRIPDRQALSRPRSKAVAGKSVLLSSSLMKLIALRVILVRSWTKCSDRFSSTVNSPAWTRTTAILVPLLGRWLHAVRAWYWECLACGDRGMNIVDSIDWPRLKVSAYLWLREPCDPTQWRLHDSRLFGELLRFNRNKM